MINHENSGVAVVERMHRSTTEAYRTLVLDLAAGKQISETDIRQQLQDSAKTLDQLKRHVAIATERRKAFERLREAEDAFNLAQKERERTPELERRADELTKAIQREFEKRLEDEVGPIHQEMAALSRASVEARREHTSAKSEWRALNAGGQSKALLERQRIIREAIRERNGHIDARLRQAHLRKDFEAAAEHRAKSQQLQHLVDNGLRVTPQGEKLQHELATLRSRVEAVQQMESANDALRVEISQLTGQLNQVDSQLNDWRCFDLPE